MLALKAIFGIGGNAGPHHHGSKLIHPDSMFAILVQIISMLLLLYTALYTPVTVGFYWNVPPCYRSPTLEFDVLLDSFFLFEIIFNFFVGTYESGAYIDEHVVVVEKYIKGNFAFDVSTSIPGSIIDFITLQDCQSTERAASENGSGQHLKLVRLLKPLRLLKMSKVKSLRNHSI